MLLRKERLQAVKEQCPIYGITGGSRDVVSLVQDMLSAGIRIIQYREKHKTGVIRYQEAMVLRQLTKRYHALLIIDDYVDLAMAVHADGVHVGHDDLPPSVVRRLVGPDMLLGWSTHSIEDLKAANRYKDVLDYVGTGPVFQTPTKPNAVPVGLSYVHWAARYSRVPIVAIGGVKTDNVESVWQAQPDFICAVSELNESSCMKDTVQQLLKGYTYIR